VGLASAETSGSASFPRTPQEVAAAISAAKAANAAIIRLTDTI
jgi:hypothetical protein